MIHAGKKCLIALLLLVMTLWTTTAMAASGTVKANSLVLREEASSKSDALQTLPKGSEVTIVYKDGSWYKVKYGRYTGFVMTRYISTDDDIPTRDEVEGLQKGSSGSKVKELQRRLRELGYYTGSVDGSFGAKTEDAVKAFQKRNGLTADGVVGEATQKKLNSSSAKPASSSSSSSSSGSSSGSSSSGSSSSGSVDTDGTLRIGSSGSAVKAVQRRLKELGYYNGSVDGAYGSGTATAVRAFQKRNKLTVDGTVGPSTLKALNSSSAKPAEDDDDDDDGKDDSSSSSSGAFDGDGNLTVGSRGEVVKTLQNKLKSLGYYKKSIDGIYGTGTVEAVKTFQKRNNLTPDGVAGEATLRVLYSSSAKPAEDDDDDKDEDEDDSRVESSSGLRAGDRGSEVKDLQRRLKELGYYKNSIDGSFGTLTEEAVKAFQKNNKLTVDGIAGAATIKKLNSSSAVTASGGKYDDDDDDDQEESSSSSSSSQYDTLRPGATGTAVKEMQYRLKELGYYSGSRDGVYGSGTRAAVMSFQTVNGLTVDGIAGSATLKKLYSSDAKRASSSSGSGSGSSSGSTGGSSGGVDLEDVKEAINPGDKGEAVKALQTRLKELGYYTNTIDGEYGYGTRQAVIAFQKNNGLTQDGIAGTATIKKMISSSAVGKDDVAEGTYVTERLDWFHGGASKIPRGAIFQIKDVRTGRVFTGKRQGGSYHMDVEPLTAADTAILLKINGGVDFSWRRRPMLVLYNGHVYACSIYSEPHGSDTIPNNNFDGQFCLHFYGSMTHGTDRVDEDHQACEAQALKATW